MSRDLPRAGLFLLLLVLAYSSACNTASPSGSASNNTAGRPELTAEKIREDINGVWVEDVPEENNASQPIDWAFQSDEPKEFSIVEKTMDGNKATVIIDMKTGTAPGAKNPRQLSGRLRLLYELRTGWVLRKWRIYEVENISMKYRNEPKQEPVSGP